MKLFRLLLTALMLGLFSVASIAGEVNINTADASALSDNLKGVGPKIAQAIVDYRKQHGPFKTIDDLANVKGIGLKTVSRNRDTIVVSKKK